jgi:hypothetical protein
MDLYLLCAAVVIGLCVLVARCLRGCTVEAEVEAKGEGAYELRGGPTSSVLAQLRQQRRKREGALRGPRDSWHGDHVKTVRERIFERLATLPCPTCRTVGVWSIFNDLPGVGEYLRCGCCGSWYEASSGLRLRLPRAFRHVRGGDRLEVAA